MGDFISKLTMKTAWDSEYSAHNGKESSNRMTRLGEVSTRLFFSSRINTLCKEVALKWD